MSVWLNLTPMVITSIWPSVVKEKTTPIDRNLKIMNKTSVFESDFLTNDSLVLSFVFYRGRQRLTRLHQTSIGINWIAKGFFDNQCTAIRQSQNIFRVPLFRRNQSKAAWILGSIQLGRHSEKGQNANIGSQGICMVVGLEDVSNQRHWDSGIVSTLSGGKTACNISRGLDPPMWPQLGLKLASSSHKLIA